MYERSVKIHNIPQLLIILYYTTQDNKAFALDRSTRVKLGVALSNDLNENPHRAREVLSNLETLEDEEKASLDGLKRAKINYGLGKAYRYLLSGKECTDLLSVEENNNSCIVYCVL